MTAEDERKLDEALRRAVGSDEVKFDAQQWMQQHPQEAALLRSWKQPTWESLRPMRAPGWRQIMHSARARIIGGTLAAAAVIIAAVVLLGGNGQSSKLYAQALRELQTSSYTFKMDISGPDAESGTATVHGAVVEPGRLRLDAPAGDISFLADRDRWRPVLLWHAQKVAMLTDEVEDAQMGGLAMLLAPGQSILDLWGFETGEAESLGEEVIDGRRAEGFRTRRAGEACGTPYQTETTVWADTQTHLPLRVRIALTAEGQPLVAHELYDFDLNAEPDESLMEIPPGYALGNRVTLAGLMEEKGEPTPSGESASDEARKLRGVFDLWKAGQPEQAVDALLAIDWDAQFLFPREQYVFSLSEADIVALTQTDREVVLAETLKQLHDWRALANAAVDRAQAAMDAGDYDAAESDLQSLARFGQLVNRKDCMIIVRMVGLACERLALQRLKSLYEQTGEAEKLDGVRSRQAELERQLEAVRPGG